jgi:hypothetical protein
LPVCDSAAVPGSRPRFAVLAAVVFVLAGCGSSGKTIQNDDLSKLVLHRNDLPHGFAVFVSGPQVSADQSAARSDPKRFGRAGGWIARYNRGGSPKTKGPLVVASRVDVFKSAGGAKRDFGLYTTQLRQPGAKPVDVGKLGDQAVGVVVAQTGGAGIRSYAIAWREANATAELELNGFRLRLPEALALARKQETRLRNAAG